MRTLTLQLVLILLSSCCGSSQYRSRGEQAPLWINQLPRQEGMMYAVGISGPTYFVEDAKIYAAENARRELAKALSTQVQALSLSLRREHTFKEAEVSMLTVSSWVTDVVVLNSQIVELWLDLKAEVPNSQPSSVYALAVIDLSAVQKAFRNFFESRKDGGKDR